MKKYILILLAAASILGTGCDTLQAIEKTVNASTSSGGLTETDIVAGLKQALEVGTGNAVGILNKNDGYLGDALVKIMFPAEAQRAADKLRQLGMGKLVDDFVVTMNRAAERASAEAKPIFVDAVKSMTISDARSILSGPDNAATEYFKGRTTTALTEKFTPVISNALNSSNATKYWTDITTTYNKIPLVTKVETDLVKYTTGKALDGLFTKLADEEKKIRVDPAARVTALLQKVFGAVKK
ncbi:MAG: hypothetical protein RLZZ165_2425 [Bacteroidota bacterium]